MRKVVLVLLLLLVCFTDAYCRYSDQQKLLRAERLIDALEWRVRHCK